MKQLPTNITTEKNKMHGTTPWIVLLEITLTDTDNSGGPTVLRLCSNNEDVLFGGYTYTAFPFAMSLTGCNTEGKIPTVYLKVCNISRLLSPYLLSLDGGLNSEVKATVINTGHLAEDYTALELVFSVLGCKADSIWVTWTLGMANPKNQRFPLYRFLAEHCAWTFNNNIECPYVAGSGETEYTTCNRTIFDCITRGMQEYFFGFLGMANDSIRLA